jgi:RimJ/RimL family protein N-acetyltransferase
MRAPTELTTTRLTLVQPGAGDAAEVYERYASDPEVTRFLGWPRHQSIADTVAFLTFSASEWVRWPAGPYLIRRRADGCLLGATGLGFESPEQAITGYVLAKDAWGQGFATESLRAMVELARQVGVACLHAFCHPSHRASTHVLEKCGFVLDPAWTRQTEFPNLAPGVPQAVLRYVAALDASPPAGER